MIKKEDLIVIQGGLGEDGMPLEPEHEEGPKEPERTFVSAWITDTRLMAVNAMYVHWKYLDEGKEEPYDVHHFFYFDSVTTGFERFAEIKGNDEAQLNEAESSYAGGLGGNKVELSEREVVSLFHLYHLLTLEHGHYPPENFGAYVFYLHRKDDLSDEEKKTLFAKMCTGPLSKNELVNYFMMQICNRDEPGIIYLSEGKLGLSSCENEDEYTLFKNDITEDSPSHDPTHQAEGQMNGSSCYAESVVEGEDGYEIWRSKLTLTDSGITSYERTSKLKISDTEAFLSLSHPEYIMVYDLAGKTDAITRDSTPLTRLSTRIEEEDGVSFMLFRPNNSHVDTEHYKLFNDIFGVYHITTTGQLVTSANTRHDMGMLELDLVFSPVYHDLQLIGNYEFNEPVMAQFLAGGFDDFNVFMKEITTDPD